VREPHGVGGDPGSSAAGPEQPARLSLRPLRRADLRHLLHLPSQSQPSQVRNLALSSAPN
jgi:hypothetical protein